MKYKIVYSGQATEELDKARMSDKQRFDMLVRGVSKLKQSPLNTDNIIHGIDGFFSEKASGQIRIFYSIHHAVQCIFIVWINTDEFKHNTNDGQDRDPCYKEFIRLYRNFLLESFIPPKVEYKPSASPIFTFRGNWGDDGIYAKIIQENFFSEANLSLYRVLDEDEIEKMDEYVIDFLNHNSLPLADILLSEVVARAKTSNITLTFELYLNQPTATLYELRARLERNGFTIFASDSSMEVWILD